MILRRSVQIESMLGMDSTRHMGVPHHRPGLVGERPRLVMGHRLIFSAWLWLVSRLSRG